mgnify:CR=1 FL=1
MNKFIISRNGSLFKVYSFLYYIPLLNMFLINDDSVDGIFNDICTFIRKTLLTLFVSLPIFSLIIYFALNLFLIQPFMAFFSQEYILGGIVLQAYAVSFIMYLIFLFFEYLDIRKQNKTNVEKLETPPGKFSSVFQLISNKHRDLCQRIEVKD